MEVKLTLALPRDQLSVPIARRILKRSLESLGIDGDTISDIELALTEACTNVLDHAHGDDDYTVSAGIDGETCVIEVIDRGGGFDGSKRGLLDAEPGAEDGRGIQLMRALVDRLEFQSRPTEGTVVHLEKRLTWDDDAPIAKLEGSSASPR
jgi:serine/threonine-protein kinase RsbW